MAMVKLGNGITDINGKCGGDVWRTDQCGPHVQAPPRALDHEPTPAQLKRRKAFRECVNYYRKHATVLFAQAWSAYAYHHPHTNKKGETVTLTWTQAFVKLNIYRAVNDLDLLQYPPGYEPPL